MIWVELQIGKEWGSSFFILMTWKIFCASGFASIKGIWFTDTVDLGYNDCIVKH